MAPGIRFGDNFHGTRFPTCLQGDFPYFVGARGDDIHIGAEFARDAPVLGTPHVGELANALLFFARRLVRSGDGLGLLPVFAGSFRDTFDALLCLGGSLYEGASDVFYAFVYIILVGLTCSRIGW